MELDREIISFITNISTLKVIVGLIIGFIMFLFFAYLSDKLNKIDLFGVGLCLLITFPLLAFFTLVIKSVILTIVVIAGAIIKIIYELR